MTALKNPESIRETLLTLFYDAFNDAITGAPVTNPRYPNVKVTLRREDNHNAFMIISRVKRALKEAGASWKEIEQFSRESTKAAYEDLLQVAARWVEVE